MFCGRCSSFFNRFSCFYYCYANLDLVCLVKIRVVKMKYIQLTETHASVWWNIIENIYLLLADYTSASLKCLRETQSTSRVIPTHLLNHQIMAFFTRCAIVSHLINNDKMWYTIRWRYTHTQRERDSICISACFNL